jgi:hypothetical protein|tara:strand:+ start:3484 stop:3936 length:453 start_codon:yes stop_codon:yes gene_type:complete
MNTNNVLQLKLANGEEIICELLELADEDSIDEEFEVVARNCLKITTSEMTSNRVLCMLKPWMSFQDTIGNNLASINPQHIVSRCIPSDELMEQYERATSTNDYDEENDELFTKKDLLDAADWMQRLGITKEYEMLDSDENVIKFPEGRKH